MNFHVGSQHKYQFKDEKSKARYLENLSQSWKDKIMEIYDVEDGLVILAKSRFNSEVFFVNDSRTMSVESDERQFFKKVAREVV